MSLERLGVVIWIFTYPLANQERFIEVMLLACTGAWKGMEEASKKMVIGVSSFYYASPRSSFETINCSTCQSNPLGSGWPGQEDLVAY